MSVTKSIKAYWLVTKPRLWLLLLYTGLAGYFMAGGGSIDAPRLILLFISLLTGTAGANTVTSYIDRDIDRLMERTRNRPIPSGMIDPPEKALIFGLILSFIGLATSIPLGIYPSIFMLFGLIDNIIIYSLLTKRRTKWNIILGSFSGGAPTIIGFTTYTGYLDLEPILWAGLIVIWTPVHIWSLALFYRRDYYRAGVPMLPAVTSESTAIRCIASSSSILIIFSILIPLIYPAYNTLTYIIPVSILDAIIVYLSIRLILKPTLRYSWILFKYTSPYLAIIFTIGILTKIYG